MGTYRCERRRFLQRAGALASLGLLSGCGIESLGRPQPPRVRRIGFLSTQRPDPDPYADALRQGLRDLGWTDGENLIIEPRYAEGQLDRLPTLVAELLALKVELIHAAGTPSALAVRKADPAIPMVIATAGDPVAQGLAASLARPGGSVTGLTSFANELTPKRIELLKEAVPTLARLGVLKNPLLERDVTYQGFVSGIEKAAQTLSLHVVWGDVRGPDRQELAATFLGLAGERPDAVFVIGDPATQSVRGPIAELALRHRMPTMGDSRDSARAGQMLGYGPSFEDQYRRSATHVDKLLKGANAGDLPIEQPAKFDFAVNLKTAQSLGLTIPPPTLQQATEVIQ